MCGREVLRDPDREGVRDPVEALVQNRCAVYAGAHLYHHICDQHDRGLGEGDGEAAEPDISKDSDTKGMCLPGQNALVSVPIIARGIVCMAI